MRLRQLGELGVVASILSLTLQSHNPATPRNCFYLLLFLVFVLDDWACRITVVSNSKLKRRDVLYRTFADLPKVLMDIADDVEPGDYSTSISYW